MVGVGVGDGVGVRVGGAEGAEGAEPDPALREKVRCAAGHDAWCGGAWGGLGLGLGLGLELGLGLGLG